ncbi:MAG: IS3 family transposase [Microbacteriaceae bacterium]|nr:MAG: IS3 family transposase [Microbacteriaceae bacterium]
MQKATNPAITSPTRRPAPAVAAAGAKAENTPAPIIEPSPMTTASARVRRRARAPDAVDGSGSGARSGGWPTRPGYPGLRRARWGAPPQVDSPTEDRLPSFTIRIRISDHERAAMTHTSGAAPLLTIANEHISDVLRAYRINALHDAHHEDPTFGYRYLADEARRAGWRMSRRTAWKLCSQAGILSSAQRRRRGKGKKAGPPVFDDHVQRVFRADAPNRLWLTDITEHWTSEGKLYCCAIKDVFSNRIDGYSISDRMTAKLAVDAVRNAVARRGEVAGCILHADRGSQFRSRAMARELRRHDMVGSMGRVGAAGDNAAMESFWSLLQTNVLNQQRWATRQELRLAIVVWIERKYHRQRAQDTLGGLTPIEFEAKLAEPLTLAA